MIYQRMNPYLGFFDRLLVAFNYLIGRDCDKIQYTEVLVTDQDDIKKIRDFFEKAIEKE